MAPGSRSTTGLSTRDVERIESEVKRAALEHLHAPDAATALGQFTDDVALVSNARWWPVAEHTEEMEKFYGSLAEVHIAEWQDIRIDVVSADAAVFTAGVRWRSTDTRGETLDLKGVWTALYVREGEGWKIRVRHESFEPAQLEG